MKDLCLGHLIEGAAHRDAVHIAVAPVTAKERLYPGDRVGFPDGGSSLIGRCLKTVGIVDPFLREPVHEGQQCWLFLDPGSITALRHEWTHPAFADDPVVLEKPATQKETAIADGVSRRWLENFAMESDLSYEELICGAMNYINHDAYLISGDKWEGHYVPDEFWAHFEVVTSERVPESNRGSFFSCSC